MIAFTVAADFELEVGLVRLKVALMTHEVAISLLCPHCRLCTSHGKHGKVHPNGR